MEPITADNETDEAQRTRRELVSKWFIETQVPSITHMGLFPNWFHGFIPRKDAEEMLDEKELGCFMIRLSDKTLGYILSFKGRDRCRHFVINQSERRQFIVCGDTKHHNRIVDLLEYYKTNPIKPFGDYLTSSCFKEGNEESYDVVQFSSFDGKPDVAVRTVSRVPDISLASKQKHTQPKRENALKAVPPLPRRSPNSHILYAQLRKHSPRGRPPGLHTSSDSLAGAKLGITDRSRTSKQIINRYSLISDPDSVYAEPELLTSKCLSLPLLDCSLEEDQLNRFSLPPKNLRLSPKPVRLIPRCVSKSERTGGSSGDVKNNSGVYHLLGRAGKPQTVSSDRELLTRVEDEDHVYAEVGFEASSCSLISDSSYKLIPGLDLDGKHKPTDEESGTAKGIPRKNDQSSWRLKISKWKRLFPAVKKK